jgi:hypothetical protein
MSPEAFWYHPGTKEGNMLRASSICLWLGAFAFESGAFCQNYVEIVVGSGGRIAPKTFPTSINEQGEIVGFWEDPGGRLRGFVRAADGGTITSLDWPHPSASTRAQSINGAGAITGDYAAPGTPGSPGFVRDPEGNFTSFNPPGSISTGAVSINAGGAITGYYYEANFVMHGFVREPNGKITSFDPPGSISTKPVGINATGTIAGSYSDTNGTHGFVRRPGGTFVSFDPRESIGTSVTAINNAGAITGSYTANGRTFGFVRRPGGTFVTFDAPGSLGTGPTSINDKGAITGQYSDSRGLHGFVRSPEGLITSFDPLNVCYPGTVHPASINKEGVITGWCYLANVPIDPGGFARYP